jgi:pilus assembly protein Flp/PilA
MNQLMLRLWRDEAGQDLTEYALLLVLIALAAIASVKGIAGSIENVFNNASSNLATKVST